MGREITISRELGSGWGQKFQEFLSNFTSVGQNTNDKYVKVVRALMNNRAKFTIERASRFSKQKNRLYVRAAIMHFMDFLEYNKILDPAESAYYKTLVPKVREPPPKPRQLPDVQQLWKIVMSMEKEYRHVGQFLFYTGCRASEALGLKYNDVDWNSGQVTLYGKGRTEKKPRAAKIPIPFAQEIYIYLKDLGVLGGEYAFLPDSSAKLNSRVDMFNQKFARACNDILGRPIGSHEFRRVVGSVLLGKTKDLQMVQRVLGHADVKTTQKYTQYTSIDDDLNNARSIMGSILSREPSSQGKIGTKKQGINDES